MINNNVLQEKAEFSVFEAIKEMIENDGVFNKIKGLSEDAGKVLNVVNTSKAKYEKIDLEFTTLLKKNNLSKKNLKKLENNFEDYSKIIKKQKEHIIEGDNYKKSILNGATLLNDTKKIFTRQEVYYHIATYDDKINGFIELSEKEFTEIFTNNTKWLSVNTRGTISINNVSNKRANEIDTIVKEMRAQQQKQENREVLEEKQESIIHYFSDLSENFRSLLTSFDTYGKDTIEDTIEDKGWQMNEFLEIASMMYTMEDDFFYKDFANEKENFSPEEIYKVFKESKKVKFLDGGGAYNPPFYAFNDGVGINKNLYQVKTGGGGIQIKTVINGLTELAEIGKKETNKDTIAKKLTEMFFREIGKGVNNPFVKAQIELTKEAVKETLEDLRSGKTRR